MLTRSQTKAQKGGEEQASQGEGSTANPGVAIQHSALPFSVVSANAPPSIEAQLVENPASEAEGLLDGTLLTAREVSGVGGSQTGGSWQLGS